jgi:predicted transcriptional regulator
MCNLSWNSIKNTLAMLESKGNIDDVSGDEKRKHYSVTGLGREVLGYYSGLQELVQV